MKKIEVEKYLFTPTTACSSPQTGNSNDVSVIDVARLKVVKSVPVGHARRDLAAIMLLVAQNRHAA
jgi:hypothetical protein